MSARIARPSWLTLTLGVVITLFVGAGLLFARTVTQPLNVQLRTHIRILQKNDQGAWEQVDEVGPRNVSFNASMLDMAAGRNIETAFALRAKTKKGRDYSVRLAEPAKIDFNPVTGRFVGDIVFEVSLDGKSARVVAQPTTEAHTSPLGSLKGRRAQGGGLLGKGPTTVTLVSANRLQLPGEPEMMLVCEEQYRMAPSATR